MLRGPSTEQYICEKFLEMMESKPCFAIKVTELVKHAQISRSSFYCHFDSISDVIKRIEDNFLARIPNEKDYPNHKENPHNLMIATNDYLKKNIKVLMALCGPYGDPAFSKKLTKNLSGFLERNFKMHKTVSSDVEKKLLFEFVSTGSWGMNLWWLSHSNKVSIEDLTKAYKKISQHLVTLFD